MWTLQITTNPPYSVKYFKQHLALKNNSFDLLSTIKNDGKEIEVLFVERIAQLLKPSGIAAVILPSSILSNDSNCYIGAREEFLKHFYIRAIVAFGSKTFGATGTNTVVMFLEKYNEPPEKISIMEDSVNAILNGENLEDWIDKDVFSGYTDKIGVTQEQYKKYIKRELSLDELEKDSYFKIYNETYSASSEFKNIEKTKKYQNMSSDEKKALYKTNLYEFIDSVEKDKLLYFSLAYNQKTVIIQAPSDNKEQKDFLGYDWSNRKGNEGIQINVRGGKLYNDKDRRDDSTLAAAIRTSFNGEIPVFTEKHSKYGSIISTADMLDFSRENFNKAFNISNQLTTSKHSKYLSVMLNDIANIKGGDGFPLKYQGVVDTNQIPFYKVGDMNNAENDIYMVLSNNYVSENILLEEIKGTIFEKDTIIFPKVGMAIKTNKKRILTRKSAVDNNVMAVTIKDKSQIIPMYLYEYMVNMVNLEDYSSNANPPSISAANISKLLIPFPPIEIQERIVTECTHYDDECKSLRSVIDECKQAIENIFNKFDAENKTGKYKFVKLAEYCDFNISKSEISDLDNKTTISFIEMASLSNDGVIENRVSKSLSDVKKGSYTYFAEKDIIIAKITPCMENGKCAIATGLENGIGFGSSEFHTLRCKNGLINEFLFGYLNRHSIREKAASVMTGSSGHRRVPIYFYSNMMIPLLSEEEQIEVINNMTRYKQKIAESEEKLKELSGKTTEILNKYLY